MKDLTAKEWIEQNAIDDDRNTGDLDDQFYLDRRQLNNFLAHFTLDHKMCSDYCRGKCNNKDAPNPGHSRCIGTRDCTQAPSNY